MTWVTALPPCPPRGSGELVWRGLGLGDGVPCVSLCRGLCLPCFPDLLDLCPDPAGAEGCSLAQMAPWCSAAGLAQETAWEQLVQDTWGLLGGLPALAL